MTDVDRRETTEKENDERRSAERQALLASLLPRRANTPSNTIEKNGSTVGDAGLVSAAQQAMWLACAMSEDPTEYNVATAFTLRGVLVVDALKRAFQLILERHQVLKSSFTFVNGDVHQRVSSNTDIVIEEYDASGSSSDRVRELIEESTRLPFVMEHGSMFRILLFRTGLEEWVLAIVTHHLVCDAWSIEILAKELIVFYEASIDGRVADLQPLKFQYADYARWQKSEAMELVAKDQLEYLTHHLEGLPDLALGGVQLHQVIGIHERAHVDFTISPELNNQLCSFGRQRGLTQFMVLLGTLELLLMHHSGQNDFAIGTRVANRLKREWGPLIGLFVNTLVLRADLGGDPSVEELFERIKHMCAQAYARQLVPFDRLVQRLNPVRRSNSTPLFQVLFGFNPKPRPVLRMGELEVQSVEGIRRRTNLDLDISLSSEGGEILAHIEYRRALFDDKGIQDFVDSWQKLLKQIVETPSKRISELTTLPSRHYLYKSESALMTTDETLGKGSGEDICELPEERIAETVIEMFDRTCVQSPDCVALTCEGQTLSFRDLNRRATQLAYYLVRRGARPEMRVGILMERSIASVVAMLAVLKAGAAYVPLDCGSPGERLQFIIQDAGIGLVLTNTSWARLVLGAGINILSLNEVAEEIEREAICELDNRIDARTAAYVMYTSGSTGQPKGVIVEHRQLIHYVRAILKRLDLPRGASYAMVSTLASDLGNTVLFPSLVHGGHLHILSESIVLDAEALTEYFRSNGIDCLKIVPSHLAALHRGAQGKAKVMPRKVLVLGGESASVSWIQKLRTYAPDCAILNHYGPTETTVGVLTHLYGDSDQLCENNSTLPLGQPLDGAQVHVFTEPYVSVPAGGVGEVYIGGEGVSRGYIGRPEITAECFIPDLFRQGARLYRTGDRARFRLDGQIEFIGRVDDQIKIRGFRVELAEVEVALRQHGLVEQAVVISQESETGKQLIGYALRKSGAQIDAAELKTFLRTKLPEFMIPKAIVILDTLPLLSNGKINREALKAPLESSESSEFRGPVTGTEEIVCDLWAKILRIPRVGRTDNFFELGGHSLLATQVIAHLRRRFDVSIKMRQMFDAPTVAELALAIDNLTNQTQREANYRINPIDAPNEKAHIRS